MVNLLRILFLLFTVICAMQYVAYLDIANATLLNGLIKLSQ